MLEQSDEVEQQDRPLVTERKSYDELKEQVLFLQSYGFAISYDYVDMLLRQIYVRDTMDQGT